jgi:hypothetical protein
MPLGLMMVSRGLLTNEDLRRAVDEQKQTGEEIGEVLIRLELVSEKQVAAVRAAQWGCPTFSVPKGATPAEVVIPATLVAEHSMVPLHYVAATNQLLVGFVQSIEYGILYAIEQILGCKTQPCFVTPSDFQGQMFQREQLQKLELTPSELKFESGHSASDMARILSSYSLHLHADEAVIGKCSGFMWARLKTGPRAVDLLFKVA